MSMDSIHFGLWDLFQAVCTAGEARKMNIYFLFVSGFAAFVLMEIGLVLTVIEFNKFK